MRPDAEVIGEAVALLREAVGSLNDDNKAANDPAASDVPLPKEAAEWSRAVDLTDLYIRAEVALARTIDQERTNYKSKKHLPLWGYRTENIEAFAEVRLRIDNLQKALDGMPSAALFLLFAFEKDGACEDIPSEETQQKTLCRLGELRLMLNRLRARCSQLLDERPGVHKSRKHRYWIAAESAYRIMRLSGLEPASGVCTSVFGKLASLMYEALSGEEAVDIYPVCRDVLKEVAGGRPVPTHHRRSKTLRLPQSLTETPEKI